MAGQVYADLRQDIRPDGRGLIPHWRHVAGWLSSLSTIGPSWGTLT
jgi:hypothetical protein